MVLAVASVNPGDALKMVGVALFVASIVLAAWAANKRLRAEVSQGDVLAARRRGGLENRVSGVRARLNARVRSSWSPRRRSIGRCDIRETRTTWATSG
jgi:hypothetical protein